ncbi:MAG: LysM peptidoglycan-binding domain-containing protein [Ardenticatenaceae bacterium]|nr:LysM peptidoglycan-binding domain-containing protein [Ardenticatenaceae bacterium]MCB9446668.1 LysM peptidoglycan-binding domain-containing protein [Ardenticatenaceae bacterium]
MFDMAMSKNRIVDYTGQSLGSNHGRLTTKPKYIRTNRFPQQLGVVTCLILLVGLLFSCDQPKPEVYTPMPAPTLAPFFRSPNQTATSTATPQVDEPQIIAVNPAPKEAYMSDESIDFDWDYPIPLTSDQQFLVQISTEAGNQIWGAVTTPLTGSHYRLSVDLMELALTSGNYQWFVVLETISSGQELLRSIPRPFTVHIIDIAATPALTVTLTLVPNMTSVPSIETSLTPIAVCTPSPPADWKIYTVQENDFLFNLAITTGTTVERIQAVNCLAQPGLGVGQRLWLPILPPTLTPTSTLTPAAPPTAAPSDSGGGGSKPKTPTPPPLPTPTT